MFKSKDDFYEQATELYSSILKCTIGIVDDPKATKDDLIKATIICVEQFVESCENTNQDDLLIMEYNITRSIEHCTIDLLNDPQFTKRDLSVAVIVGIDYWIKGEEIDLNSERNVI